MYLLSQLAIYLLTAFALGVAAGYGLWRTWGEQENIEKYKAAEQRLAEYLANWERRAGEESDKPRY